MRSDEKKFDKIRTRFAPSPTGFVHIGSVQKMLYSYSWAKKHGGDYILRIEDTDQKRTVDGAIEGILEAHELLGLKIDEQYLQSERLEIYKEHAEKLIELGVAYRSFETASELDEMRKQFQMAHPKASYKYRGKWRDLNDSSKEVQEKLSEKAPFVVRLRMPDEAEEVLVQDEIVGEVRVSTKELDDYVLLKSDGFPTYHLASVVDDALMQISHVFRGVEWLPTAPVHVLLYKHFGYKLPSFVHIPNILDPKGGKLSKRSGSVALREFFAAGYLPEAILNFMMLLGWAPKDDQEIFSLEQFCEQFDIASLNKSNPVFNRDKLIWFNGQHIRKLSLEELWARFCSWGGKCELYEEVLGKERILMALELEKERIKLLSDLTEKLELFVSLPESLPFSEHKQTKKLAKEQILEILGEYLKFLETANPKTHEHWEQGVREIVEKLGLKAGEVFMSIRIAVTGAAQSPPIFEFAQVIGEEKHKQRVAQVISLLS
ncbi:MAG: glutamate--tRNA ligase [Candidatus Dojkabacteria bacterium]